MMPPPPRRMCSSAAVDAFAHLDLTAGDPIRDIAARIDTAGLSGALLVERWSGEDRRLLEASCDSADPMFRHVFCVRAGAGGLSVQLEDDAVLGLRVKGSELEAARSWLGKLAEAGKTLLVHSDQGVGPLAHTLGRVALRLPSLRIYVPHLAWPTVDGLPDAEWEGAVDRMSAIRGLVIGVSAIAHFSREGLPHPDVLGYANRIFDGFSPDRIVIGSDYPLFEKTAYGDYMALAREWVCCRYPGWTPPWRWPAAGSGTAEPARQDSGALA